MKLINLGEDRYVNPEFVTSVNVFYLGDDHCAVMVHTATDHGFCVGRHLTRDGAKQYLLEVVDKLTKEAES